MTRAIILAASCGNRYKTFTRNGPRCLLEIQGKTILDRQIESFQRSGIHEITVVGGHFADRIVHEKATVLINEQHETTNNLHTLFLALEKFSDDDVVVSYGDIIFSDSLLKQLLNSRYDVSLLCDLDWGDSYRYRMGKTRSLAETIIFQENGDRVEQIGKQLPFQNKVKGELVGLMRFKGAGFELLKRRYHHLIPMREQAFQNAQKLSEASLVDWLQDHIDLQNPVHAFSCQGAWLEIDTLLDYEYVKNDSKTLTLIESWQKDNFVSLKISCQKIMYVYGVFFA
jgi:choline kinase